MTHRSGAPPTAQTSQERELAVVLGGGGAFGIAFHLGLLHGLESRGVTLGDVPMLGVSAGTWAAAAHAQGTPLEAIIDVWTDPTLCAARPAPVLTATRQVFGRSRDPRVTGVVIKLPSGCRVTMNGASYDHADIVAAASSPPVLAKPYILSGRRVYDAGVIHNTCADIAPAARTLLVLAPLGAGSLRAQGMIWEHRLRHELAVWRRRHGGNVVVVRPSRTLVALSGSNWDDLMNGELIRETYGRAFEDGVKGGNRLMHRLAARTGRARQPSGLLSVIVGR